jgi:ribosome-binding factor A
MSKSGLRARRVAALVKEELGGLLVQEFQHASSGFITVTRVDMPADLRSAHVYLSVFGTDDPGPLMDRLEKRKGYIRKTLASRVKLKYNPELFFALDSGPGHEERIDRLIEMTKKHDR